MATNIPEQKQVGLAKRAAALKAKAKTKATASRPPDDDAIIDSDAPRHARRGVLANPRGPPRLIDKHELLTLVPIQYASIWKLMREGTFPRARAVGGRSLWLETEIAAWIAELPNRYLLGDPATNAKHSYHNRFKAKEA